MKGKLGIAVKAIRHPLSWHFDVVPSIEKGVFTHERLAKALEGKPMDVPVGSMTFTIDRQERRLAYGAFDPYFLHPDLAKLGIAAAAEYRALSRLAEEHPGWTIGHDDPTIRIGRRFMLKSLGLWPPHDIKIEELRDAIGSYLKRKGNVFD